MRFVMICAAEDTARVIDAEVRGIISAAEVSARKILTAQRDVLARIAERLLEIEVIDAEELKKYLAAPPAAGDRDA